MDSSYTSNLLRRSPRLSISLLFYFPIALSILLVAGILTARYAFGIQWNELKTLYDRWRMRVEGRYKGLPATALDEAPGRELSAAERGEGSLHDLGDEDDEDEEATRELESRIGVRP